jgi:hypothetical protein
MSQDVAPPEPNPVAESEAYYEELEVRMQRLEDAVAALCDLQGMEDRLYERLVERFKKKLPVAEPLPSGTAAPKSSPNAAGPEGVPLPWPFPAPMEAATVFGEIWQDIKLMWAMMRDPLYTIPWLTRLVVLIPLGYIAWSTLAGFHNGILGLFGYIIDVVLLVPLLYLTFKVWQRELRRYRQTQVQVNYAARR